MVGFFKIIIIWSTSIDLQNQLYVNELSFTL